MPRVQLVMMAVVALLLAACKEAHNQPEVWAEYVSLQSGETIEVARELHYEGGDIGESHGPLVRAVMKFNYHGTAYNWDQRGLRPLLLQVNRSGNIVVISSFPTCWAWSDRGSPAGAYVYQEFSGGHWLEKPVNTIDVDPRANLSAGSRNPSLKLGDMQESVDAYRRIDPLLKANCQ